MRAFILQASSSLSSAVQTGWGNAYVSLLPGDPYYGVEYDQIHSLNVHRGLTFGRYICELNQDLKRGFNPLELSEGYLIGCDFAHFGDTPITAPKERVIQEALSLRQQLSILKTYMYAPPLQDSVLFNGTVIDLQQLRQQSTNNLYAFRQRNRTSEEGLYVDSEARSEGN